MNSSKPISGDIYEVKMRSAGELDNLLEAGTNFRNKADGQMDIIIQMLRKVNYLRM